MNQGIPVIETAIKKKEYSLCFLSPMVMHGAKPWHEAEFRTPSIKGVLRYWWRSLQLEHNAEQLLEDEVKLFGGIKTESKCKSPVSFSLSESIKGERKVNIVPHKNVPGVKAIVSEQKVTLKTIAKKRNKNEINIYDDYLQYMFHLAGMGQRARRGFGATQWEEHKWENRAQFISSLKAVLKNLGKDEQFSWNESGSCVLQRVSAVRASHPILNAVYIGEGKETVQELLVSFGKASHEANKRGNLGAIKPRWASPLWCTIRRFGDLYYPIVTEMTTNGNVTLNKHFYERDRKAFLQWAGVKL